MVYKLHLSSGAPWGIAAPPMVHDLRIVGDLIEGNKIAVTSTFSGGVEGPSRVQWFKTSSRSEPTDESTLEAVSNSKVAKVHDFWNLSPCPGCRWNLKLTISSRPSFGLVLYNNTFLRDIERDDRYKMEWSCTIEIISYSGAVLSRPDLLVWLWRFILGDDVLLPSSSATVLEAIPQLSGI